MALPRFVTAEWARGLNGLSTRIQKRPLGLKLMKTTCAGIGRFIALSPHLWPDERRSLTGASR
jgi:hypothetical protein